jgi:malate dehydrogenase (oxaloacetate-decarboxylating)(NADP+)
MWEASAVAKAAIDTGVARVPIDIEAYRERLEARLGKSREVMRNVINKARRDPKRIVYPEGCNETILHACQIVIEECIAKPILLGDEEQIQAKIRDMGLHLDDVEICDYMKSPKSEPYAQKLHAKRGRKGMTLADARRAMRSANYFAAMMVSEGDADGMVAGVSQQYPDTLRPALQVISTRDDVERIAGVYLMVFKDRLLFLADTTVNIKPTAEALTEIALGAAEVARRFDVEPRVAIVTFSNFGSVRHEYAQNAARAVKMVRERDPDLIIDGEMQADTAVAPRVAKSYPFSVIQGDANVLVFSSLTAANVAYKLLQEVGGAEGIGPILVGMRRPVHVLQVGSHNEKDVVNMTAIAVLDAQGA